MISTRKTLSGAAALFAAAALVAGAVSPAIAAPNDPDTEAKASAKQNSERPPLSRKARKLVWCVTSPAKDGAEAKKECKTRETWIREGHDPFGQY